MGIPSIAKLPNINNFLSGKSGGTSFDPDSEAWLSSQGITDINTRIRYSDFYTLCKTLTPTLWSRLMMVSLRSTEAPRKTWGGGKSTHPTQIQGDFVTGGSVTYDANGATLSYTASPSLWANRIQTPAGFTYSTHRSEPYFIGSVYKNQPSSGTFVNSVRHIGWNVGTTSPFIGSYSGGDTITPAWQTGVSIQGAAGGQYVISNAFANNSKDAHQFIGYDFQNGRLSVAQLSNERYALATHASIAPNTSTVNTGLWFHPGLTSSGTAPTGTLSYLVFISGGIIDIVAEAKKFWQILRTTLLRADSSHIHFANGGQSLSTGTLQRRLQMRLNTTRTVTTEVHSYGGTYISAWIGSDPNAPVRASQYLGGFYKGDGTGTTEATWPFGITKGITKWINWLQGESDTELRSTALVYQQQLQNLFNFLTADFGSDFKMAVNLLDYSLYYRTGGTQGNFTISGITGSGSSANGAWTITPIASILTNGVATNSIVSNANANYSWTKSGGWTISKNGSDKWEIAVSGTIYATSVESYTHPELCTWVLSNGATGSPTFSESRTGNIERVRLAQSSFVAANSDRCVTYDSRGCARAMDTSGTGDGVHPDASPDGVGEQELAYRASLVMAL
jgi:hypothetical protein